MLLLLHHHRQSLKFRFFHNFLNSLACWKLYYYSILEISILFRSERCFRSYSYHHHHHHHFIIPIYQYCHHSHHYYFIKLLWSLIKLYHPINYYQQPCTYRYHLFLNSYYHFNHPPPLTSQQYFSSCYYSFSYHISILMKFLINYHRPQI